MSTLIDIPIVYMEDRLSDVENQTAAFDVGLSVPSDWIVSGNGWGVFVFLI